MTMNKNKKEDLCRFSGGRGGGQGRGSQILMHTSNASPGSKEKKAFYLRGQAWTRIGRIATAGSRDKKKAGGAAIGLS